MRDVDIIAVGGGIAGLIAAGFAAKSGANVLLLEASPALGGRARTRNIAGFHFNQGAHAFYRDGFLDHALRDLGVAVSGNAPALASGYFVDGGKLHGAPFSADGLAATSLLSGAERRDMATVFRRLIARTTEPPPGTSLQDALAALSPSPKIRAVVAAMVRLTSLVHAPEIADGQALLDQLRGGLTRKVIYMDGGWGTMIDGLRTACIALGAEVRASARVASIEPGPPWRVALADGAALTARAIVLAVNPAQAAALYPALENLSGAADPVPAKVACLDIGLARLPRPDVPFALGVGRPLYFSVHSAAARLTPDGGALVHTARFLAPGERPGRDQLLAELEGYLDLVQPGWRDQERARQFLPAMPAISAMPLAAAGGTSGRPGVAVPNSDGLFVAGDWVGPAGLLADAAAASGRTAGETAAKAVEREKDRR